MATGGGTCNIVILTGRLGQDPELKYTPAGVAVANFSMATNRVWKNDNGEVQKETDWHRIVLWRKTAEIAGEYLTKGSQVQIIGRLQTRKWQDKDGNDRWTTEVIAENNGLVMLGSKSDGKDTYHEEPPDMAARAENSESSQQHELLDEDAAPAPKENDLPF